MPYITTVNGVQTHRVEVTENGTQRSVTLDDVTHAIDWQQVAPLLGHLKSLPTEGGCYSVIIAGTSYEIFARRIISPTEKEGQTYEIHINGLRFEVKVEDERTRLLTNLVRAGSGSGAIPVQAPMPGLVAHVPVEPGMSVNEGQTVIVLEAMKMENDLTTPISGTVKEVRVSKGQTVDQGEVLIIVTHEE